MHKKINSNHKFTFVKPLTQSELADGWKLIVPSIKYNIARQDSPEAINSSNVNDNKDKKFNNIYRSKINLAQLPYHLWNKISNNKVVEKSHIYYIQPTDVDEEIKELVHIVMSSKLYSRDYVINILKKLKDGDIHGWPIIKAMRQYSLNIVNII